MKLFHSFYLKNFHEVALVKKKIEIHNSWKPYELSQLNKQARTSLTFLDLEQLHKTVRFQDPQSFKPEPEYLFPLQTATTRPLSDLFIPQSSGKDSRDSLEKTLGILKTLKDALKPF